ncbi:methyl-accepting chemotaxis protein [Bosea sp. LjRoot90]|uniref:methyl-accepting chemotaxis protein n=1 Tax=Bosea sp. LjRoot90 TaxID=3342342 RepID=UPI003ECC2CBA
MRLAANLTIKQIFLAVAGLYAALILAIGVSWYYQQQAAAAVSDAYRKEHASYLLADEFRQSSDDLTRLARTFAVTGNPRYEQQYLDVIAMRSGEKARPAEPHRIYWDLVLDNAVRPRGPGETKALLTAMKEAGFTDAEFGKLNQAQSKSDALVNLETRAMNAAKGSFEDGNGRYTVKKEPDLKLARDLLHSADYDRYKADIMKPVDEFFGLVEARTRNLVETATTSLHRIEWLLTLLLGGLVALVVATGALIVSRVVRPLAAIRTSIDGLSNGELETPIPQTGRQDEVGAVAAALLLFRDKLVQIRALEAQERAEAAARAARAEAMSRVVSDVGEVVAAAAEGDFSARLQIDDADEQMQKLVAGINQINAVVDSATTEFVAVLQRVAEGDLTQDVATEYRGRFGELKTAVNETVERLSSTVRTIQLTAADVGLSAREIATGADDLSKRTEEQASSLEESAATTEELAASVKASAQASRQAATTAEEAMRAAEGGGTIAGEAIAAMARIESASKKISDITRVIDDIAFQTNLLALNAAVEAARAGDAGKGFAVVASEVRTLAQRSGEAAKDISGLISSSNIEVDQGVKLVRQAGEALTQILAASQKVASTIGDISSAAVEQANGIEEMSQTVAHMDEMTQQNAALSEQSAASANALNQRISQLNELVAAFRTGVGTTTGGMPHVAPPRQAARPTMAKRPSAEPARLQKLAETAFSPAPRKVANAGKHGDSGWAEF